METKQFLEEEARAGTSEAVRPLAAPGSPALRRILVGLDAAAAAAAWSVALVVPDGLDHAGLSDLPNTVAAVVLATVLSLALIASQRLYLARECSVRALETVRLGRTAVLVAVLLQAGERQLGIPVSFNEALGGAALGFLLLRTGRYGYRSWLEAQRRQGRRSRPIVVVGSNDEAYDLYHLLTDHPELGYRVCGVVGDPSQVTAWDLEVPWLGELQGSGSGERLVHTVQAAGANGVLVAASALAPAELNRTVRGLLGAGIHVHLSSGLKGIGHRRLRSQPFSHEPLFYLEPATLAGWQVATKRVIDVVLASFGLVVAAPVLAVCALAIKLHDGGPVFFRQERVGRDGRPFTMLKLRSMEADAESRLAELMSENERQGALFKLSDDPRITPVGRLLRATSLDELPQLINVVRGEMSLVGPRPALAEEVACFDEELLARQQVLPGITGLWQVEARDSASFRAYRRLDLFYVENWSIGLDFAVLVDTVYSVAARGFRMLWRRPASIARGAPHAMPVPLLLD